MVVVFVLQLLALWVVELLVVVRRAERIGARLVRWVEGAVAGDVTVTGEIVSEPEVEADVGDVESARSRTEERMRIVVAYVSARYLKRWWRRGCRRNCDGPSAPRRQ